MLGDWSVDSLLFPLLDVLEVVFFMEWGVCDKSIFVGEAELYIGDVSSLEA